MTKSSTRFFGALLLALLTALLLAAPSASAYAAEPDAATPRIVTNIAEIEWDLAGAQPNEPRGHQSSNRVDIAVAAPPVAPFTLTAYRFSGNEGSLTLDVAAPRCGVGSDGPPVGLAAGWQSVSLAPASLTPVGQINAGEPLLFVLDYAAGNRDPSTVESVTGAIVASSGDREILTVFETGPNTGKFAGYIQTVRAPPPGIPGDCKLAVGAGDQILVESLRSGNQTPFASASVDVLVDPFGMVFDSIDAKPVSGTRITLVDDSSGQPATVFGDDGNSVYPSTIVAGEPVTDSGGTVYTFPAGDYRFPLVRPGRYRLLVEPAPGYTMPSVRQPAELANLRRPDGLPFTIVDGSYGRTIVLADPAPVRIDIPVDPPSTPIILVKNASASEAEPGGVIQYRISLTNPDTRLATGPILVDDRFGAMMRLRAKSVRVDGAKVTALVASDGRSFRLALPALAPGGTSRISYALDVRADAAEGDAINQAEAVDDRGNESNRGGAIVRIRRDSIADRMTIIGRVTDGGCVAGAKAAPGLPGVRLMLEDGSYAVTDADGRYHFEGVKPGTHVVQLDDMTLPADRAVVECRPNTRSAGRTLSRFVDGGGGALKRVDFRTVRAPPRADRRAAAAPRPAPASDAAAAGAERDWFAGQEPGIAWVFPAVDHIPRAPVVRVAIKHAPGQKVRLLSGGRPVDPIAFEGSRNDGSGTIAISLWRGIPLETGATRLTAEIRDAGGALVETLDRTVHYGASPMRAELLRDKSLLIADGVSRPVIAVRLTDRDGRPVRHGLTGDFEVPAPYYPAVEADAQQARQLAGLERARPFWRVQGEEGIAYIELEPTTASGSLSLRFNFREGESAREQRIEAWLDPGQRPWTIVGLAEGTIGYNRLDARLEALGRDDDKLLTDGRLALYAKGRIKGRWLMTLAYDSDKKEDETRFGGTIDPRAYYTIYADRSERRYDAASVRRLYLKLERPQFYALFGDYETGIDEPVLARYVRAFNGVKAEYRSKRVAATAFAADAATRHRRDEIQGNGLTGPYALGARSILANSERISIEVRDRLRSDLIVERRLLARYVDYDIDYRAGTLRFREPILSRSSALDPQFIIAEYEVDGVAGRTTNAGARATWRTADQKVQVGATIIRDSDESGATSLAGADLRYRPSEATEIRAEVAVSDNEAKAGAAATPAAGTATAWQVEAEHHGKKADLLAYVRQRESGFGLGQTSGAEDGTRKLGVDARVRIGEHWSLTGSAWHEDYLGSDARRIAGRGLVEYRGRDLSARIGLTFADDRLADGRGAQSTILQIGATKRLFANKLELDAQTEIPLGSAESIDFPARHRLAARYAVTSDVQLVASYEIADGDTVDARTARIGFDLKPWAGARIAVTGNLQDIAEYGPRSFAAFGLSQSFVLDKHWSVDLSLDGNKTIGGIDPARVLNPLHPVASGGFLAGGGALTEDFTAVTAGATYRNGRWSLTGRAEYRAGDLDDRYGFTAAALRQIGEGSAVGASFDWFAAKAENGARTETRNLQLSWMHRPAGSPWSWANKLELREDRVTGAVAGTPGPIGIPLLVDGDARSRRVVNALSINYSPEGRNGWGLSETSVFWGSRYVAERLGDDDVSGWSNLVGADLRFDLGKTIDVGGTFTIRQSAGGGTFAYSGGPNIGIKPFENGWMSIGWNIVGFHDRDFAQSRYTSSGPYLTMRVKFDQLSLQGLGLGRR
jgi:hypothetical protein